VTPPEALPPSGAAPQRPVAPWRVERPPEPPDPLPTEIRPYQGHRAGIVTRVAADSIDFAVVIAVVAGLYLTYVAAVFLLDPTGFVWPDFPFGAVILLTLWVQIAYLTVAWGLTGRSLGKQIMGLRLLRFDGTRIRLASALLRAIFCTFFPIGLFWVVLSGRNRSLQDMVLRTSCVYDWRASQTRRR
jgi:uncharacterized RDD family membrane protein YckC